MTQICEAVGGHTSRVVLVDVDQSVARLQGAQGVALGAHERPLGGHVHGERRGAAQFGQHGSQGGGGEVVNC